MGLSTTTETQQEPKKRTTSRRGTEEIVTEPMQIYPGDFRPVDIYDPCMTQIKSVKENESIATLSLDDLKTLITGDTLRSKTLKIRSLPYDSPEQKELKGTLPAVVIGGTFPYRELTQLKEASGFMVLDFDHGPMPSQLEPYALFKFKSPRDKDKVIIRIPLVKTAAEYTALFRGVQQFVFSLFAPTNATQYQLKKFRNEFISPLDTGGSDISRATFICWSPEAKLNLKANIWVTKGIVKSYTPGGEAKPEAIDCHPGAVKEVLICFHDTSKSRHLRSIKAGNVAGNAIRAGLLNREGIIALAYPVVAEINDDEYKGTADDMRSFISGIDYGMQYGLSEYHKTAILNSAKANTPKTEVVNDEDERIRKALEAADQEEGDGFLTGWDSMDQLFKVFPRSTTLIYSQPNVGKTLFLFTMAVSMSKRYGWKWFIYSPETGREGTVAIRIAEVYTGKDASRANKMSREELTEALKWVHKHFYIYERTREQPRPSVNDILTACDAFSAKTGIKVNGVVIDTLSNTTVETGDRNNRIDLAYESMLDALGQWMLDRETHVFMTSHMTNVGHVAVDKATGHLIDPTPNFTMIKGGQALPRMGYTVIALHQHRPATFQPNNVPLEYNGNLYFNNSFYAIIQKIKPYFVGRKGMVHFRVDYAKHKIFDVDAGDEYEDVTHTRLRDYSESTAQQEIEWENPYNNEEPDWIK